MFWGPCKANHICLSGMIISSLERNNRIGRLLCPPGFSCTLKVTYNVATYPPFPKVAQVGSCKANHILLLQDNCMIISSFNERGTIEWVDSGAHPPAWHCTMKASLHLSTDWQCALHSICRVQHWCGLVCGFFLIQKLLHYHTWLLQSR